MRVVVFLEILFSALLAVVGFLCVKADRLVGKIGAPRPKVEKDQQWAIWTASSPSEKRAGKE